MRPMKKLLPIVLLILTTTCFATVDDADPSDVVKGLEQITSQAQSTGALSTQPGDCSTCTDQSNDPLDQLEYTACNRRDITRCKSDDTYLQSKLSAPYKEARDLMSTDIYSEDFMKIAKCVNAGINNKPVGNYYNCNRETDLIKNLYRKCRPCPSKELVGTLSMEIYMAAKCLGRSYKKILPIFVHESRFMPNVLSPSYAGGVGQLTGIAIKDMNRFLDKIKEFSKTRPECAYLNDIEEMRDNRICSRIIIPPNPRRNIIYGVYYQMYIEDGDPRYSPHSVVEKWAAKRWADRRLSQDDKDEITEVLLHVSYNAGKGVALPAFQTLRDDPKAAQLSIAAFKKKYFDLLDEMAGDEPATYHNDIVRDSKNMEEDSGADCTMF